jgi:hypothetical protein
VVVPQWSTALMFTSSLFSIVRRKTMTEKNFATKLKKFPTSKITSSTTSKKIWRKRR